MRESPYVRLSKNGVTTNLPMEWRESVFRGERDNAFYSTRSKPKWKGFWIVVTDDSALEARITNASVDGARFGFHHDADGKVATWEIVGSPSLEPELVS